MEQKKLKQTTLYALFIYIVIFSTTTLPALNRAALAIVLGCGGLYCIMNGFTIKTTVFLRSMLLYGVMLMFAKLYTTAPASEVDIVFNGYISMIIVISVITLVVDDENDIKFLLKAFAVTGLAQCIYMLSVYGIDTIYVISQGGERIRIGDEVSNSNTVGISFAISYIISLHFFLNEKMPFYKKILYIILIVVGFVFGLLSASRKALILLLVGSFAILYLKNSGKNIVKSILGILLASIVVYILYDLISSHSMFETVNDRFTALVEGLQGKSKLDHSSDQRFYMIETGWNAFKESPFFGKGLYASFNYFETYSHNNFIEILMNTGVVGFLIFYYPYIVGIKRFLEIDKSAKLYHVMLILFLWVLICGYGMVTYYSKDSMSLMALIHLWLSVQRRKKHEENTQCNQKS